MGCRDRQATGAHEGQRDHRFHGRQQDRGLGPGRQGEAPPVDPISNEVVATYDTPTTKPGVVVALGDHVWVCDCEYHRIVEFDPAADSVVRTMSFPQAGFLVGLNDEQGRKTAWLLDPQAATLTPIDVASGKA